MIRLVRSALHELPLRAGRNNLIIGIRYDDQTSARLMLHAVNRINRVIERPGGDCFSQISRSRFDRDDARCHDGATDIGPPLDERSDRMTTAGLAGEMESLETVGFLQHIERSCDHADFEQRSPLPVVARGAKRAETTDGDEWPAIDARQAVDITLHAT